MATPFTPQMILKVRSTAAKSVDLGNSPLSFSFLSVCAVGVSDFPPIQMTPIFGNILTLSICRQALTAFFNHKLI
jgi:hypothetical protein